MKNNRGAVKIQLIEKTDYSKLSEKNKKKQQAQEKRDKTNDRYRYLNTEIIGEFQPLDSMNPEKFLLKQLNKQFSYEDYYTPSQSWSNLIKNHNSIFAVDINTVNSDLLKERQKKITGLLSSFDDPTLYDTANLTALGLSKIRSKLNTVLTKKLHLDHLDSHVLQSVNHLWTVVKTARSKFRVLLEDKENKETPVRINTESCWIIDIENILLSMPGNPDDMTLFCSEGGKLTMVHVDFTKSDNAFLLADKRKKLTSFWETQSALASELSIQHRSMVVDVEIKFDNFVTDFLIPHADSVGTTMLNFSKLLCNSSEAEINSFYGHIDDYVKPAFEASLVRDNTTAWATDVFLSDLENTITDFQKQSILEIAQNNVQGTWDMMKTVPKLFSEMKSQFGKLLVKPNTAKGTTVRSEMMLGPIDYSKSVEEKKESLYFGYNNKDEDPFYRLGCYLLSGDSFLKPGEIYFCDNTLDLDESKICDVKDKTKALKYQGTFHVPQLARKYLGSEHSKFFLFRFVESTDLSKESKIIGLDLYVSPLYHSYYSRMCNEEVTQTDQAPVTTALTEAIVDDCFKEHKVVISELSTINSINITYSSFINKFLEVSTSLMTGPKIVSDLGKLKEFGKSNFCLGTDHLQQSAKAVANALSTKKADYYFDVRFVGDNRESVVFCAHAHGLEHASNFTVASVYLASHVENRAYKPRVVSEGSCHIGFLEPRTWSLEDLDWWCTLSNAILYRFMAQQEYNMTCSDRNQISLEESIGSMILFQQNRQQVSELCDMTRYVYNGLSSFEIDLKGPIEKLKGLSLYTASQVVYAVNLVKAQFFGTAARYLFKYSDVAEEQTNMFLAAFPNTILPRPESDFNINYFFDSRILNKEKGFGTKISAEAKDFLGLLEEFELFKNNVEDDTYRRLGMREITFRTVQDCLKRESLEPLLSGLKFNSLLLKEIEEDFAYYADNCFESERFKWSFWGILVLFAENRYELMLEGLTTRSFAQRGDILSQSFFLPFGDLLSGAGSTDIFEPNYDRQTKRKTTTAMQMLASYLYDFIVPEEHVLIFIDKWIEVYGDTTVTLGDLIVWYPKSPIAAVGVVSRTLDKDQFAGMREFSAMNFYGASLCRMTDGFFKGVCLSLKQDMMLVVDKNKSVETLITDSAKTKGAKFSISADCSRFGPNQTMEKFILFIGLVLSNGRVNLTDEKADLRSKLLLLNSVGMGPLMMLTKRVKPPFDLMESLNNFGTLTAVVDKNKESTLGRIAVLLQRNLSLGQGRIEKMPSSIMMPGGMFQGSLGCLSSSISTVAHMAIGKYLKKKQAVTFCEARVTNDDSFIRISLNMVSYLTSLFPDGFPSKDKSEISRTTASTKRIKAVFATGLKLSGQILNKKKTIISRGLGEMNSSWYQDNGGIIVPTEKMMFATLREISPGYNPYLDNLKCIDVGQGLFQKGVSYNLSSVVSCSLVVLYLDQYLRWKTFHRYYNSWPASLLGSVSIDLQLGQLSKIGLVVDSFSSIYDPETLDDRLANIEKGTLTGRYSVLLDPALARKLTKVIVYEHVSPGLEAELEGLDNFKMPVPGDWIGPQSTVFKKKQALRIAKELNFKKDMMENVHYFPDANSEGIGGLLSLCTQQIFSKAIETASGSLSGNYVRGQKNVFNENFRTKEGLCSAILVKDKFSSNDLDEKILDKDNVKLAIDKISSLVDSDQKMLKLSNIIFETVSECCRLQISRRAFTRKQVIMRNPWNRERPNIAFERPPPIVSTSVRAAKEGLRQLSIEEILDLVSDDRFYSFYDEQYGNYKLDRPIMQMSIEGSFASCVKELTELQMSIMLLSKLSRSVAGKYLTYSKGKLVISLTNLIFSSLTDRRVSKMRILVDAPDYFEDNAAVTLSVKTDLVNRDEVFDWVRHNRTLYSPLIVNEEGITGTSGKLYYTTEEEIVKFLIHEQRNIVGFDFLVYLKQTQIPRLVWSKTNAWVGTIDVAYKWLNFTFITSDRKKNKEIRFPWVVKRILSRQTLATRWEHTVFINKKDLKNTDISCDKKTKNYSKIAETFANLWKGGIKKSGEKIELLETGPDRITLLVDQTDDYYAWDASLAVNGSVVTSFVKEHLVVLPIDVLPLPMNLMSFSEQDLDLSANFLSKHFKVLADLFSLSYNPDWVNLKLLNVLLDGSDKPTWTLVMRCAVLVGSGGVEYSSKQSDLFGSTVIETLQFFSSKYKIEELNSISIEQIPKLSGIIGTGCLNDLTESALIVILLLEKHIFFKTYSDKKQRNTELKKKYDEREAQAVDNDDIALEDLVFNMFENEDEESDIEEEE